MSSICKPDMKLGQASVTEKLSIMLTFFVFLVSSELYSCIFAFSSLLFVYLSSKTIGIFDSSIFSRLSLIAPWPTRYKSVSRDVLSTFALIVIFVVFSSCGILSAIFWAIGFMLLDLLGFIIISIDSILSVSLVFPENRFTKSFARLFSFFNSKLVRKRLTNHRIDVPWK